MSATARTVCTGAVVFLQEYGAWVVTDLKRIGNVWFFVVATEHHLTRSRPDDRHHATVAKLGEPLPRYRPCTLVAHEDQVTIHL